MAQAHLHWKAACTSHLLWALSEFPLCQREHYTPRVTVIDSERYDLAILITWAACDPDGCDSGRWVQRYLAGSWLT